ncbi:hypothetical protein [Romboutsia sp. 1001285H_161024_C4]|uniref:hypothetical protein n=1 Tax=Romboutsia sp. 1001285H_161024_C4 TaxID=2787109 RepID=UPI00189B2216|nr:hypothetical protein [Romboutsia sp. 1001285H_161024_C4]
MRILFCKIAWMKYYEGIDDDRPTGGGKWVEDNQDGAESENFLIYDDDTYCGYVSTKSTNGNDRQIRIESFQGITKKDDIAENVLVIWVAQNPNDKKHKIVGWYKKATVYRWYEFDSNGRPFNCEANSCDCVLVPVDKRKFDVPQSKTNPKKFGMGSSQFWYGTGRKDNEESMLNAKKYIDKVIDYIDKYNN